PTRPRLVVLVRCPVHCDSASFWPAGAGGLKWLRRDEASGLAGACDECTTQGQRNAIFLSGFVHPEPYQSETLTWPARLGVWTEFAQASVALPKTAEGERWKKAVPAIISLQAVTFALRDLGRLRSREERALALDKADMLIRRHVREVHDLWRGER